MADGPSKGQKRSSGQLSVEELRLFIAANTGPTRVAVAGRHRPIAFNDVANAQRVASSALGPGLTLYVEVRPDPAGGPPPSIVVGRSKKIGPGTNLTIDLSLEPVYRATLLPGEELWVKSLTEGVNLLVSEVMI